MFKALKNLFVNRWPEETQAETQPTAQKKPRAKKEKTAEPQSFTAKEQATAKGEPYVSILKVDIDPNNIDSGSFELDWNEKFIINLIKAGYKTKPTDTDSLIVDRWFQTVCRNVALEVYEQNQADPDFRDVDDMRQVRTRDLGNGRTEVS